MKNGRIGVCVIGCGRAGMIHAANFARNTPDATLVAVVDPVEDAAKKAAAELGLKDYYTCYEEALGNGSIDAYVIVSPTIYHAATAVAIANEKKHILCEKPMALNESDCDAMIEAAERNRVKLQLGFMRRFDAGFRQAREIVNSGDIGEVVMVHSHTRGPSTPQEWMYDLKMSNGPLAEVNSHDIDTLRWITGSEFKTVYAVGGNYRCPGAKEKYPDFYDNVVMTATFENGMTGIVDGAQGVGYAYDSGTEVLGTKGCIRVGRLQDSAVVTCTADTRLGTFPLVGSWQQLFQEAYLNEDIAFIQCIIKDEKPAVTGYDGKMAVKVVNAGNTSITEKRVVTL